MEGRPHDSAAGGLQPRDPSRLRISDADRHRVAEVLRHAAGEGRIDFDELEERLEATYAAKTYADLVPITADLPVTGGQPAAPPVARPRSNLVPATSYSSSFAFMADTKRTGVWQVPEQHTAFSMMGSVLLDLREAQLTAAETLVNASSIMGDVTILVNPWTRVVVEGFAVLGEYAESHPKTAAEITTDSPVVRVRGLSLMASVTVQRKAMPGETTRRRFLR